MSASTRPVDNGRATTARLRADFGQLFEHLATRAGCTARPDCPCKICEEKRAMIDWYAAQPAGSLTAAMVEILTRAGGHDVDL